MDDENIIKQKLLKLFRIDRAESEHTKLFSSVTSKYHYFDVLDTLVQCRWINRLAPTFYDYKM